MDVGLLWYDADPKTLLEEKLTRAVARYREKYGRMPDICFVHPHSANGRDDGDSNLSFRLESPKATVRVVSAPNILLDHFWLGENGKETRSKCNKAVR